jgi:hypothetical protein
VLIAMASSIATGTTPARPSAAPPARARRASLLTNRGLWIAASLSLGAGLVHLEQTDTHWFTWWGYGLFFLVSGIGQVLYAGALVRWPKAAVLWLGIAGNLAIVAMYGYTRTNGIPWGPSAGHIERVGTGDFITTAGEFVLAGMLISALGPRTRSWFMTVLALAGAGIWVLRFTENLL